MRQKTWVSDAWRSRCGSPSACGTCHTRGSESFATRAMAEGTGAKAVAAVLGNSDARVALNVYAGAGKEPKARAVAGGLRNVV